MFIMPPEAIVLTMRQAQRWLRASLQDSDLAIANLHADYSVNTIDQLRQLTSDTEILKATGINPIEFRTKAIARQDEVQAQIRKKYPGI